VSLSTRIALLISVIVVAGVSLVYLTNQWFIRPSFLRAERDEAREHVTRCLNAIDRELHHLEVFCSDWSEWDDTYEYVDEPSAGYEETNFALTTFTDNDIDLIFVINTEGRVVWGRVYDLETEEPITMAEFPQKHWAATHPLLRHESGESSIGGIMLTGRGPMLVTAGAILTSMSTGPTRGTMVMGRLITDELIQAIGKQTLVDLHLWPIREGSLPDEEAAALAAITPDSPRYFREVNEDLLQVYAAIPGLNGDRALLARVTALRDSEARIRAIVDHAPDGIITCDERGAIESANPEAATLFGYSQDELVGEDMGRLIPEGLGRGGDARASAPDTISPAGPEGTGRRRDGTDFPIYLDAGEVQLEDRRLYAVMVRDLTDLKEMHERVLRAEHLATIGEMAAAIAHDIRNPLTGISGAVQVLSSDLVPDRERREVSQEIVGLVKRVDAIVHRLLVFARSRTPDKEPCDLRAIAERISEEATGLPAGEGARFTFEGPEHVPSSADPALVEQVFWNVVQNALEAVAERGEPDGPEARAAREARWQFEKTAEGVRVNLTDRGHGMPPEVQAKALRPFFTTKTNGTGLGLAICRRIMEAHGGSIRIVSPSGQGTTVELVFPEEESL